MTQRNTPEVPQQPNAQPDGPSWHSLAEVAGATAAGVVIKAYDIRDGLATDYGDRVGGSLMAEGAIGFGLAICTSALGASNKVARRVGTVGATLYGGLIAATEQRTGQPFTDVVLGLAQIGLGFCTGRLGSKLAVKD